MFNFKMARHSPNSLSSTVLKGSSEVAEKPHGQSVIQLSEGELGGRWLPLKRGPEKQEVAKYRVQQTHYNHITDLTSM